MNEEKIQQLKDALMELFNSIQDSGQEITPELEQMLVQAMEHVANRIQQLSSKGYAPSTQQNNTSAHSFNSEAEALSAGLPTGTIVTINGRQARIK